MREGDGEGVGGVGTVGAAGRKQDFNHVRDLRFFGIALADYGLLDEACGVLRHWQTALGGNKKADAPRLPELKAGAGVGVDEDFLHRSMGGPVEIDDGSKAFGNFSKALRQRQ